MSCAELEASPCGAVNLKENTGKKEKRAKKRRTGGGMANESNRVESASFSKQSKRSSHPAREIPLVFSEGAFAVTRSHLFLPLTPFSRQVMNS